VIEFIELIGLIEWMRIKVKGPGKKVKGKMNGAAAS
jgi:hypothetical protein